MTDNTEQNLDEYITAINFLAQSKSEFIFNNSKPELAAIVMAAIINYSDREVRIYDDCLNGDIAGKHNSLLDAMLQFIELGKKIKLALRRKIECETDVCKILTDYMNLYPKGLEIRVVTEDFRKNIKDILAKDIYFTVGDNDAYRMETTEDPPKIRKAICSFNGPEITEKLIRAFDKEFKNCEKYEPSTLATKA